jgi:hypothetical protein
MRISALILITLLFQSCSAIRYRLDLRAEEEREFEDCYKNTHSYSFCKEASFSRMNRRHETLMSIKEKNNL